MNHEDIVLLLAKCFEQAVTNLREQAECAFRLDEPGIGEALTKTAESLEEVDVEFHLCMLSTYRDELEEIEGDR